MNDDPLLSDDELRQRTVQFFCPVSRQILDGEFDCGHPNKLKLLHEILAPIQNKFCQQATGYLRCLAAKTESEK